MKKTMFKLGDKTKVKIMGNLQEGYHGQHRIEKERAA